MGSVHTSKQREGHQDYSENEVIRRPYPRGRQNTKGKRSLRECFEDSEFGEYDGSQSIQQRKKVRVQVGFQLCEEDLKVGNGRRVHV